MMELSHTIAMFSGGPAELMMMSEESELRSHWIFCSSFERMQVKARKK